MDENGTLDLSMKKTKREGAQPPEPSSSSSSSSQHIGATLSQSHTQPEWEGPLDFTKSSGVKEEDHEEVRPCRNPIVREGVPIQEERMTMFPSNVTRVSPFSRWNIQLPHTPPLMVRKGTRRIWRKGSTRVRSPPVASRSSFRPKKAKRRFLCKSQLLPHVPSTHCMPPLNNRRAGSKFLPKCYKGSSAQSPV